MNFGDFGTFSKKWVKEGRNWGLGSKFGGLGSKKHETYMLSHEMGVKKREIY